jgi:hypothetical protein
MSDEYRSDEVPDDELKRMLEQRSQVHRILAGNPNYFGNLPDSGFEPVQVLIGNTAFERLSCTALNPDADVLEATVQIRRSAGYGGDLCSAGSTEWVRFYLSYDGGTTWEDVGLGSFNAHDIPDSVDCAGQRTKPLTYTVAFPVLDPHRKRCYASPPALPLTRAILSWQVQPPAGQPNWLPIWGNRLDHHVQLRPTPLIFGDVLAVVEAKAQVPDFLQSILPKPIPEPDPAPFSLPAAAEIGRATDVPPHRFAAPLLGTALSERSVAQAETVANIQEFTAAGVEWSAAVAAFYDGQGDTTYEQLGCLGLDYNRELLVGTFTIKQPGGYSGPLCYPGSVEYVAFWADYDNTCDWTYLGTAGVRVHDIDPLPPDGLHYWVSVPASLLDHQEPCTEPKVGRIRAVLSWATPPSTTNPYLLPRWGNAIEAHIEIKPRRPVIDGPAIEVLGGIPIAQIDTGGSGLTLPFAQFGQWGSPADPWVAARQCPFGGTLTAHAAAPPSFAALGRQYRLLWRPAGSSGTGTPVTDPYVTTDGVLATTRTPDPVTGLAPYLAPYQNVFNVLGSWRTRSAVVDGQYEIRLEMTDPVGTPLGTTQWYTVKIDNTAPVADLTLTGGQPCNKANPGDTVSGTFVATDTHFGVYILDTLPASLGPPAPAHTPLSTTSPAPAGTWQLVTDGTWAQCGYVVRLRVFDRSIIDSVPWGHNAASDDVGFCLGL